MHTIFFYYYSPLSIFSQRIAQLFALRSQGNRETTINKEDLDVIQTIRQRVAQLVYQIDPSGDTTETRE